MSRLARLTVRQRVGALVALCVALAALLVVLRDEPPTTVASGVEVLAEDPFLFEPERAEEFAERASRGFSHILYELSPGGVLATAERTARFRDEVRAAAEEEGVDLETLEALVFLESAGRPDVIAGPTPESAAGLVQILPGTATDLLEMSVDLERSKKLTKEIAAAEERASRASKPEARAQARRRAVELILERRRVDERFDPPAALAGAARYLAIAEEHFGREDLAAASYHMGIGNLDSLIATYLSPRPVEETTRQTVQVNDLSYARIYFDSTPLHNPRTYAKLRALGDDTRRYLFRLEAAREIMGLFRDDLDELRRLAELHGRKASAEEVLHPPGETQRFQDADALREAYEDEELVRLEDAPGRLGYRVDAGMGELAARLDEDPALYRGLRPEALATVVYMARQVRAITGDDTTLTITSTVRDAPYHDLLRASNPQAADGYSLHTTGFAFDISRTDLSEGEEAALAAVLERLQALNLIAWVYEPGAIHVTVGPGAERLLADDGLL